MTITSDLYLEIQRCNPYRLLRIELGKTQQEIAVLAGITNKYIYRVENGLINSPTPSVTMAYVHELNYSRIVDALNTTLELVEPDAMLSTIIGIEYKYNPMLLAKAINDTYISWRGFSRWFIKGVLRTAGANNVAANLIGGFKQVSDTTREHPIYAFQYNFCRIISSRIGITAIPSQQLFSRLCTMHPRNWQLYAESSTSSMPFELHSVLLECGVAPEMLGDLENIVHAWLGVAHE